MNTYGRKKRALFPSFSVFQDNDQPSSRIDNRSGKSRSYSILNTSPFILTDCQSAYTQLGADDANPKLSISRDDADDEIDELAGTSLVNVPTQHFFRAPTKYDSLPPTLLPTEETEHSLQTAAKPLPPLPSNLPPTGPESSKTKISVLGPKSTNQKVISKKSKILAKPNISPPVLISSSTDPSGGVGATGKLADFSLNEHDRKLYNLTRQAETQEAETKAKEKKLALAEASSRPSPLRRGRSVLMTAKHAIAKRLGSPNIKLGRFKTPLYRALSGSGDAPVDEMSKSVSAPPRPLPVYESMRSRQEPLESQEDPDPFSDKMEMDEAWSDFDSIFDRRAVKGVGPPDGFSSQTPSMNTADETASEKLLIQSKSITGFSNKLSGLKQHPNPEFFSSSPVGFSTPRVRLEPTADADGRKRLSTVPVSDPFSNEVSAERDTSDDEDDPLIHNGTNVVYGSSMKRKSATEDLHSQMAKRAKTDSGTSAGTAMLAQGFDELGTNDWQPMQGIERTAEDVACTDDARGGHGFGIFDLGKREEAEPRYRYSVGSLGMRRHSRQHSSSQSRPTSVLFSRETRARVLMLDSYKEDQMDDPMSKRQS
ncbi:MAG: hypothetical protein Q9172_000550 [Xanthocarpia lactea]